MGRHEIEVLARLPGHLACPGCEAVRRTTKPLLGLYITVGDGGMVMHLYVMEMAKEYKLSVTYVVMNKACLGNVMDFQAPKRRIATRYASPNFATIAQGFGIEGIRVEDPADIRPALSKALALNEPAVVDIAMADYSHFKMRP